MEIDRQALQQTKNICHQELDIINNKYNAHYSQTIIQYLKKKFYFLFIITILSTLFILIIAQYNFNLSVGIFIIYYGLLGSCVLLEYTKIKYFQINDLISTSYLNQGRSFLYMSCLFSLFEIITFLLICIILPLNGYEFIKIALCALIPIFLSQVIAMNLIKYVSNLMGGIISYLVCYLGVTVICQITRLQYIVSYQTVMLIFLSVFTLYCLTTIDIYRIRKERKSEWNLF